MIVIISGPPGAGKTTVGRRLAEGSDSRALHLHTDDFYGYIRKGYLAPWLAEAHPQNIAVANASAAAAVAFAQAGYDVFAEGVVGPWMIEPWRGAARAGNLPLHFVVLRPDEATVAGRVERRTDSVSLKDPAVARLLWRHFAELGPFESHVLDTTGHSIDATTEEIRSGLESGRFRLP